MTLSAPLRVTWDLTTKCNLFCRYCYNSSQPESEILSPSQLQKIGENLASTGIFFVALSGGEPLLHSEIWNIIRKFKEKGKYVQLISNGTLITCETARKIGEFKVDSVQVSLDGLETTHNFQRGVKGCFQKTIKGITSLMEEGVRVSVNMVVSKRNLKEVPLLLDFLLEMGVDEFRTSRLIVRGRSQHLQKEALSPEETRSLTLYIMEQRKTFEDDMKIIPDECMSFFGEKIIDYGLSWFGCPAGRTESAVDSKGEVYPCVFLCDDRFAMGNLLESKFDDIWHNNLFEQFRVAKMENECSCSVVDFCRGGCPAATFSRYGTIAGKDPYCWRCDHE